MERKIDEAMESFLETVGVPVSKVLKLHGGEYLYESNLFIPTFKQSLDNIARGINVLQHLRCAAENVPMNIWICDFMESRKLKGYAYYTKTFQDGDKEFPVAEVYHYKSYFFKDIINQDITEISTIKKYLTDGPYELEDGRRYYFCGSCPNGQQTSLKDVLKKNTRYFKVKVDNGCLERWIYRYLKETDENDLFDADAFTEELKNPKVLKDYIEPVKEIPSKLLCMVPSKLQTQKTTETETTHPKTWLGCIPNRIGACIALIYKSKENPITIYFDWFKYGDEKSKSYDEKIKNNEITVLDWGYIKNKEDAFLLYYIYSMFVYNYGEMYDKDRRRVTTTIDNKILNLTEEPFADKITVQLFNNASLLMNYTDEMKLWWKDIKNGNNTSPWNEIKEKIKKDAKLINDFEGRELISFDFGELTNTPSEDEMTEGNYYQKVKNALKDVKKNPNPSTELTPKDEKYEVILYVYNGKVHLTKRGDGCLKGNKVLTEIIESDFDNDMATKLDSYTFNSEAEANAAMRMYETLTSIREFKYNTIEYPEKLNFRDACKWATEEKPTIERFNNKIVEETSKGFKSDFNEFAQNFSRIQYLCSEKGQDKINGYVSKCNDAEPKITADEEWNIQYSVLPIPEKNTEEFLDSLRNAKGKERTPEEKENDRKVIDEWTKWENARQEKIEMEADEIRNTMKMDVEVKDGGIVLKDTDDEKE